MCVFPTKTPKYRLFPLDESLLDGFFPVFLSVIHFNVVSIGRNDSLMASPCSVSLRYKQNRPPRPEDCTLLMLLLSTSFHIRGFTHQRSCSPQRSLCTCYCGTRCSNSGGTQPSFRRSLSQHWWQESYRSYIQSWGFNRDTAVGSYHHWQWPVLQL